MRIVFPVLFLIADLAFLNASPSYALDISTAFDLGQSQFANGVRAVNGPNDIEVDLTPGDIVAVGIVVENAPRDAIEGLFTSLVVDDDQVRLLGGGFVDILSEDSCTGFACTPKALRPGIPAPINKPNSPRSQGTGTEQWVQALAHSIQSGTTGSGPDFAGLIGFTVQDRGALDRVEFVMALTPGDVIFSPGGVLFAGPINFSSAVINIPEPGTALLVGVGLIGLIAAGRRPEAGP